MKPTQIIKHTLSFSKGEQRGIFVLVFIIFVINILRIYIPDVWRIEPFDFSAFRKEIETFEQALQKAGNERRIRSSGEPHPNKSSFFSGASISQDSGFSAGNAQTNLFVIDLNHADTLDLQRLRGIGPSFARRITGYRSKLGGFTSANQLMEVFGMDSARFKNIRSFLTVDTSAIQRINLNSISFKELIGHPYMPYEFAKEIALYRKRHKRIGTMEELKGLKNFDSIMYKRLSPYLEL